MEETDIDRMQLPDKVRRHINHLEQIRKDFVANVSHELRTPLTVIKGYLESLLKKQTPEALAYQTIYQQMLQHSARMENIIDDLLMLSRLESHRDQIITTQQIDVAAILENLANDAQKLSGDKKHNIKLNLDTSLAMSGGESELKSLFSNLIVNAVKYTLENGSITIDWFREDQQAVFRVTDTGIGMEARHIPRITERFYCVDKARSRERGGTGLGLAIAKHVLVQHQAELKIESELGKGSCFSCIFPRQRVITLND